MLGDVLVQQAEGVRQGLAREHLELAAGVAPGQVADRLAAPVEHQDAGVAARCGQSRRRRVGHMVRDELHDPRVQTGQGRGEEAGGLVGVVQAQVVPRVVEPQVTRRTGQPRIEGVGHRVEVLGLQPCLGQCPARGHLGQLPRGERDGPLTVLAAVEPLFLRGRHDFSVDDQRHGRIVEERVDAQDFHRRPLTARPVDKRCAEKRFSHALWPQPRVRPCQAGSRGPATLPIDEGVRRHG